ncbi:hypothetical protein GGX14DRAFT_383913 [Mycena pura]|uniref:Uncharacterized protein n=1 Tax=Mycena pura TaxID=153505 RepID=A0AAD7E5G6_9AGAR|nr:hypothetical protein GGX14DRAFT_383913 [Mycena pura]
MHGVGECVEGDLKSDVRTSTLEEPRHPQRRHGRPRIVPRSTRYSESSHAPARDPPARQRPVEIERTRAPVRALARLDAYRAPRVDEGERDAAPREPCTCRASPRARSKKTVVENVRTPSALWTIEIAHQKAPRIRAWGLTIDRYRKTVFLAIWRDDRESSRILEVARGVTLSAMDAPVWDNCEREGGRCLGDSKRWGRPPLPKVRGRKQGKTWVCVVPNVE